eukprot:TRINITY_DN6056_c0_g1_i6.p1 TRINITY_DN6056_c0_g1~~TRINITY_DN6056_c0_g1_i6.p1  ORF type:complete len:340 (+),score=95.24 TRINITY_DN6056_c0_g1_i6:207-1226(+)
MGTCKSMFTKDSKDEVKLPDYEQIEVVIGSYTKGLKTRLKDVMLQSGLGGYIRKTIYNLVDEVHDTPVHTQVIAGGKRGDLESFSLIIKEVVEESIDLDIRPHSLPEFSEEEKKRVVVEKTDARIANRKASDAGDDNDANSGILGTAVLVTNQMKNRAKQVLNVVSDIPLLSEYTNDLKEKWSLLVKEQPKELICAKSLFHPFSVYSFAFYPDDGPSVMKACLEWKLQIPYDSIELYTTSGVPLNDSFTLTKEKQCIFVDARITKKFFDREAKLKSDMMKITKEPFVYHNMALHEMTLDYMVSTFKNMNEMLAQEIIRDDLKVSGNTAVKILAIAKGHR